jgi:cyclophilin family peptidyl-prolyl cis-trans isomerase
MNMKVRALVVGLVAVAAAPAMASGQSLSSADSSLVHRVLAAEDRRDPSAAALQEGARHADERIRMIAMRARLRIADPAFKVRDSLASLPAPTTWPEPAWRLRYRALAQNRDDCTAMAAGLGDSEWPVRLRAANLVTNACSQHTAIVTTLREWVDGLTIARSRRERGTVTWHAAAHGLVGLARVRPDEARPRAQRLASHEQWQVRMYAARAAALLADTSLLRRLVRDRDDNVKEAAIDALSKLTAHGDDSLYIAALVSGAPQVVRAAAIALKGSPRSDVGTIASAAFERWTRRGNASERDARVALLEAAGRPASDDRPPRDTATVPRRAVALALGERVHLRVTMSPMAGGGSFVVRLRGDNAPIMAARVLELANRGYYDNGNWWRVEHDFVIQGGGPGSNEYTGYHMFLRDELGNLPHTRGTVGMSTRGHHTGDAQWFINVKDNVRLIQDYTVFAEVVEGIEVVDGIMEGDTVASVREEPVGK